MSANLPRVRKHAVNRMMMDEAPLSARIADRVTSFMGSWAFIGIQTVIVAVWIIGNTYMVFHFDLYPFVFLNLAFSTQAAYAAPSSCWRATGPRSGTG
jgi:uncharacterized membrane protein